MKTILVQKRGLDWYRNQGRLISILSQTSVGYLIMVSTHNL